MTLQLGERGRRFVREVGSIVLGVLIALGIGEMADDLRWRARAGDSTRATNGELAEAAGVLDERVLAQPCLDQRIADLDALLRAARRTSILPAIGTIGQPPIRPIPTAAWDDAVASGVLLHLEPKRRSALALIYPLLRDYPRDNGEEAAMWAALRSVEGAPGAISDDLLAEASMTVARVRWASEIASVTSRQVRDALIAGGIRPSYQLIFDRPATRSEVIAQVRTRPICRPLTAARRGAGSVPGDARGG